MAVSFYFRQTAVSGSNVGADLNQLPRRSIDLEPWRELAVIGKLADDGLTIACERQIGF